MSGYIIVRWTLRVSPLEGYRERHEYQTFSLQSCAAYFHSLNVIMKPQYSCPCPARPSTAIKSILRETYLPQHHLQPFTSALIGHLSGLFEVLIYSPQTHLTQISPSNRKEMLSRMFTLLFYIQRKQIKMKKNHILPFKSLGSVGVFNSAIKCIKSNSKDTYNVKKISISNKCCYIEPYTNQRISSKRTMISIKMLLNQQISNIIFFY